MVRHDASDMVFLRRAVMVVGLVALTYAIWLTSSLFLVVFAAALLALTLRTLAAPLTKLGLSGGVSVALVAVTVAVAFGLGSIFFGAELVRQLAVLNTRFGEGLRYWIDAFALADVMEKLNGSDIAAAFPVVLSWGVTITQVIVGVVLALIGALYIALSPYSYREGVLKLVPDSYRSNIIAALDDISEALTEWLRGLMISMFLVGSLTGFGLWIAGVKSALMLGVIAGLSNFVPYVGSIAAAVLILVVAAAQGWETFAWAAAIMLVVQQIESYIISPLVVGGAVHIPPATGLFALVAVGMIFGPLGIILGFPLTIVADILIRRLYVRDFLDRPVEILGEQARCSDAVVSDND